MKKLLGVTGLILSVTGLKAQDSASLRYLTEEEAVATALQNNFDIRIARNDSIIAAIDFAYRDAAFLPQLNANAGMNFNNNAQNQTLADGTKRDRSGIKSNSVNASIGLNWVVFDGLQMFIQRDRLDELMRLGELLVREQVVNTVTSVQRNYYDIVRQKQQLAAVEELMALNQERLRLAEYRLEVGVGVKPDVLQAQIDLNAQRAARLTQLTLIRQLKQQLNQLMNIAPDFTYEVTDTIPFRSDIVLGDFIGLEATNPTLQIAQQNVTLAQTDVRLRRAERFPTVSLNSAYNFSRTDNQAVINPFQPLFNQNRGFVYGISASIPILNNFSLRRNIRQAEQSVRFRELQFENQQSLLRTAVLNSFETYELQKQAVTLEEENLLLVRENLMIARERYRLGVTTFIELREAQQRLAEAQNRLIQARFAAKSAEIELTRLRGDVR